MDILVRQIGVVFQGSNILYLLFGTLEGILIGAVPGLTVTMAIALTVPITIFLPFPASMALLLSIYVSGIYGGSVSAILINTPGTPAAAATTLDGYPLAKQGKAGKALKMTLFASFFGGTFSIILLVASAQYLSKVALLLGPPGKAALFLFALTIIGVLSGESMLMGILSAILGLLLAAVGTDPIYAIPRFTLGIFELNEGFSFIPSLIGLFAISEFLVQAENNISIRKKMNISIKKEDNRLTRKDITSNLKTFFRSSSLGAFVGLLPGMGATVACFLGYGGAKRASKNPGKFGNGALEGVAASESANNAVSGATLIPLLALSIPGDAVTAILYGALLMQGIQTGPLIFNTHLDSVYIIYITLFMANIFMVICGRALIPLYSKISEIPKNIIFPIVFILCVAGSFAIRNNIFDIYVMLGFGVLGYILKKYGIPLAPLLIGLILGPLFEASFLRALAGSGGSFMIFIKKPIALTFLILASLSVLSTIWKSRKNKPSNEILNEN